MSQSIQLTSVDTGGIDPCNELLHSDPEDIVVKIHCQTNESEEKAEGTECRDKKSPVKGLN